jgi:hypothetical protein
VPQTPPLRPTRSKQNQATQLSSSSSPSYTFERNVNSTAEMMNLAITFLLNLSLFALVEAAPMSVASAKPWQAGTGGGIVGFIVLVLDIIAWSTFRLHPISYVEFPCSNKEARLTHRS